MIATNHAKNRWTQRFPELDMATEYAASKGIGKGPLYQRATSFISESNFKKDFRNGGTHYMLISKRSGAVFVMDSVEIVITILKIPLN